MVSVARRPEARSLTARLAPAVGLRAAAYRRVSSEEQVEGYSLDAQSRAIRQHCEAHGWQFVREYADERKSARTDDLRKRPDFSRMLADAGAGHFDVIVVHKLDRFSRNLSVMLDALDHLGQAGVSFVSLTEQIDYSTPSGKLFLAMLGGLAQWYSDNLSAETKKGKAERKAQGLYNGLLPFAVAKGSDGIPVADTRDSDLGDRVIRNSDGLTEAFALAARGRSDAEIARYLNAAGYRTTGNRGRNLFTKDSVCVLLQNRFYLGELPDGNGGWLPGKHEALIEPAVFAAAQEARLRNTSNRGTVRRDHQASSLSGVARCARCHGNIRAYRERSGRVRLICATRVQTKGCDQPTNFLDLFEQQIEAFLATFTVPEDVVAQVLDGYAKLHGAADDTGPQRTRLQTRLENIRELFGWGDYTREHYLAERADIQRQLDALRPPSDDSTVIEGLARFLRDLPAAWRQATPSQRNRLLKRLVTEVWIDGDRVIGIRPQPEFEPFFRLDFASRAISGTADGATKNTPADTVSTDVLQWRKRRDSNPRSQP